MLGPCCQPRDCKSTAAAARPHTDELALQRANGVSEPFSQPLCLPEIGSEKVDSLPRGDWSIAPCWIDQRDPITVTSEVAFVANVSRRYSACASIAAKTLASWT